MLDRSFSDIDFMYSVSQVSPHTVLRAPESSNLFFHVSETSCFNFSGSLLSFSMRITSWIKYYLVLWMVDPGSLVPSAWLIRKCHILMSFHLFLGDFLLFYLCLVSHYMVDLISSCLVSSYWSATSCLWMYLYSYFLFWCLHSLELISYDSHSKLLHQSLMHLRLLMNLELVNILLVWKRGFLL